MWEKEKEGRNIKKGGRKKEGGKTCRGVGKNILRCERPKKSGEKARCFKQKKRISKSMG